MDTIIGNLNEREIVAKGTYGGTYSVGTSDIAIYYSRTYNVSSTPGDYSLYYCASPGGQTWQLDTIAKTFAISVPLGDVARSGLFQSGDSIYAATYGAPYFGTFPPNDFFDPETGNYVMTCLNQTPSPVVGTRIP